MKLAAVLTLMLSGCGGAFIEVVKPDGTRIRVLGQHTLTDPEISELAFSSPTASGTLKGFKSKADINASDLLNAGITIGKALATPPP